MVNINLDIKNCLDYKPWAITAAMNNGYPVHVEKKSGANITGVSIDDRGNTISGITAAMEFSTDGVIWTKYNDVAPNLPALTGNLALQLRYAETATHKNGIVAKFEFKKPEPEVSNISGNVVDKNDENIQAINVKVTTESNGTKTLELKAKDILVLKTLNGVLSTMLSDSSKLGFSSNSDAVISISSEGIINIKNLAKGTNSKIALTYDLGNGKKITIGYMKINVDNTGNTALSSCLIDPYGTITDSETGSFISGSGIAIMGAILLLSGAFVIKRKTSAN